MAEEKIIVVCTKCQSKNRVPSNHGKIEVTCGRCKEKFVVWSGEKPTKNSNKKNFNSFKTKTTNSLNSLTAKQKKTLRMVVVFVGIIILGFLISALSDHNSTAYNINNGMGDYIDYAHKTLETQESKDRIDTLNQLYLPYGPLK